MDDINESEALVLHCLGNDRANSIWEAGLGLQKGWEKPSHKDSRKVKEDWIKSKYMWKGFIAYSPEDGREWNAREKKFSNLIYEAARNADIYRIAEGIAKGGSLEWKNESEGGKTALHICATSTAPVAERTKLETNKYIANKKCGISFNELDSMIPIDDDNDDGEEKDGKEGENDGCLARIVCAELLIQNGAKIDATDGNLQSVLDCSLLEDSQRDMIEYLAEKVKIAK